METSLASDNKEYRFGPKKVSIQSAPKLNALVGGGGQISRVLTLIILNVKYSTKGYKTCTQPESMTNEQGQRQSIETLLKRGQMGIPKKTLLLL